MTRTNHSPTGRFPFLALCMALLGLALPALAGELETRVSTQELYQGETLELLLRYRGDRPARPDLKPLEGDFDVLDVGSTQRSSVINGVRDESFDWSLTLAPRRPGTLRVPALRVGDATSAPFDIEVLDGPPAAAGGRSGAPVLFEVEVDNTRPYVQGKVQLTARLYLDESIQGGALTEPELEGALMEQAGEDQTTSVLRDGKRYTLVERKYALFPQESGPVHIPPLTFEGTQRGQDRSTRSPFDDFFGGDPFGADPFASFFSSGSAFGPSLLDGFFDRGQRIRVRSNAIDLEVQPKPSAAAGTWWLPAEHVELVEEWDPDPPVFRVGEQVTRRIAIQAVGLSGDQMPELELPAVDGLKQYPEPSQDDTVVIGDQTVAVKARSFALLPTRAGELTLPAVEVEWWDIQADRSRVARLPERTIQVQASSADAGSAGTLAPSPFDPYGDSGPPPPTSEAIGGSRSPWIYPGLPLAAAAALLSTVFIVRHRKRTKGRDESPPLRSVASIRRIASLHHAERDLERACKADDPDAAAAALLAIGQTRWPDHPPLNPAELGQRLQHVELQQAIESLERARFAVEDTSWIGADLQRAYRRAAKSSHHQARQDNTSPGPIPALYPTH